MAFKVMVGSTEVICDTLEDMQALMGQPSQPAAPVERAPAVAKKEPGLPRVVERMEKAPPPPKNVPGGQGLGPAKAWDEAEDYRTLFPHLTRSQARSELTKLKKEAVAKALADLAEDIKKRAAEYRSTGTRGPTTTQKGRTKPPARRVG